MAKRLTIRAITNITESVEDLINPLSFNDDRFLAEHLRKVLKDSSKLHELYLQLIRVRDVINDLHEIEIN